MVRQPLEAGLRREASIGARIDFSQYLGNTHYLYCITPSEETLVAEQRRGAAISPGETIWLSCDLANLRLFAKSGDRFR